MTASVAASAAAPPAGGQDFSLVLGGPLFQLLHRLGLYDDAVGLLRRRIAFFVIITWAPLLLLSAAEGLLFGVSRSMPFMNDTECHLRFLLAVPLLIIAELVVHQRMQPLIAQFQIRGLVRPAQMARFTDALNEGLKLRNSVVAEVLLLVAVYAVGILVVWRQGVALHTSSWYRSAAGGDQLSLAGLWFVFVSLPIYQFLLLRWYFRLFIWAKFLWRVSRLDLDLNPLHPDKAGGLSFVGGSLHAFTPIAAAHGVMLTGMMANRIFYEGAKLTGFQVELFGAVIILLVLFSGPMLVFSPLLARVKRTGLREYGALAQSYVRAFDTKWLRGGAPADEALIGSGDIQSLADLGNSYAVVEHMRLAPLSRGAVLQFVGAILIPIVPLLLTIMSPEKLIGKLVGIVL